MFNIGQKVVCIKDEPWINVGNKKASPGPSHKEVCVIDGINPSGYLYLENYNECVKDGPNKGARFCYNPKYFRPVVEDHKGMEVLKSILINPKKKITSDQFDKETV